MSINDSVMVDDSDFVNQLAHMIRVNVCSVVCNGSSDTEKIIDLFEEFWSGGGLWAHEHMYLEGLFAAMVRDRSAQFFYSLYLVNDWTKRAKASRGEGHLSPIAPMELSVDKITEDFMRVCCKSIERLCGKSGDFIALRDVSLDEAINTLDFDGSLFTHALDNLWVRDGREHGWTFYDRQHNGYLIATMRHDVRSLDDALAVLRVAVTEAVGNLHYRDKILSSAIYSTKCTLSDISKKIHNYFWDRVLLHVHDCGIELRPVNDLAFWDAPEGFEHVDCFTVDAHDTNYNLYCND